MRFDRAVFFKGFRAFYKRRRGAMPQEVVDSVEFLLGAFQGQRKLKSIEQIAYALATIAHETAWTFAPIKEYRSRAGTKGRANQDRYWLTGYYGRGYVQLTWERNYKAMSGPTGVDLVSQPDLAMVPDVAFKILIEGMTRGSFTTKKLGDYINASKTDYVNARRVINGTDKAQLIAGYAGELEAILEDSLRKNEQAAELLAVDPPESEPATKPSQESSSQSEDEAPPPIKKDGRREETGDQEFGRFDAFLPQIDTAKGWLKRATAGTGLGAVLAFIFGLPQWLQIGLFSLLMIIVIGGIVMFVMYHKEIFAYVTKMNTLRATEDTGSPVIVGKPPTD